MVVAVAGLNFRAEPVAEAPAQTDDGYRTKGASSFPVS